MGSAAVEKRGRRAHEVKAREQLIELNCPLFAVELLNSKAHGHPHEKRLWQFYAPAFAGKGVVAVDEEIAVVQGLQAKVVKLQVAFRSQRLREPL